MTTIVGWYSLAVGVAMVAWWAIALRLRAWGRKDRTRTELAFHLMGEATAASWCIVGGAGLLLRGRSAAPAALVGFGLLLYTVIVSPGYFVARREYRVGAMFGGLLVATVGATVSLLREL